ncbi:ATP-binding protein [Aldersonia kunmingensis]|uniref:ATP-binding protein n=1 Tax=Aldersonia kunmingensis TaxID=408066 RepID=UPI00082D40B5|nr:adenylate/guanylate cyclase domain-containing protein [Aldersonia kunmingensis]
MTACMVCGSCGTELRENAKFCDACGTPTAVSGAAAAEYKQVTVLFADVVASMDIAAAVDAERYREIMSELVARAAEAVRRYSGNAEYTGDGVMAIFGAPVALEDHAFRACLAALDLQTESERLAAEVARRDGISLQLRVGLNSGEVIAGEIGSGAFGYGAVGRQIGMAQRMESVAAPGGVLLSESTARLVEHLVTLGEPEHVHIKGAIAPVVVRRLLGIGAREAMGGRREAVLVGRRWEMAVLDAVLERAIGGHGGVVDVVGPPGIGKSRTAREVAAAAAGRGVEVFWVFCESHATDIAFHSVIALLRAILDVANMEGDSARAQVREKLPTADPQDLLLLDDLLGIADPEVPLPALGPDARRRRLTALINGVSVARTTVALYIIEDVQWIDEVSESMLADVLAVIPQTRSMVLFTARPEYRGALTRDPAAQTIALAPLANSDIGALLGELMGSHPSVDELAAVIAERAAGNPFFVEEMVRELAQRGVLSGEQGGYSCFSDAADVAVPVTVQAAIEARIDRLSAEAKQTLYAASVIGARFGAQLLATLEIDPMVDELLGAELIDQVRFIPTAEYAFRHPLIHAVAYESQLVSDRAQWHRRLAAAIESGKPESADQNAAEIAEHLQAAGEVRAAYGWHMRAGTWLVNRGPGAARLSWERARLIADSLPDDGPDRLSMRIAPRTMLSATDWQGRASRDTQGRFAELRELCDQAGDKVSLAIGMTGLTTELFYTGYPREAARLGSEQMALLESIGDPVPFMGLAFVPLTSWFGAGEFDEILRWSQIIIDLSAGDSTKGAGFGIGSPLAIALAYRGVARWWSGRPGWQSDLHDAISMARGSNPTTLAGVLAWAYSFAVYYKVIRADDSVVHAIEEAVQITEASRDDTVIGIANYVLGVALLNRDAAIDRKRGLELMEQARDLWLRERFLFMMPITDVLVAREKAKRGDRDAAIVVIRDAIDEMNQRGNYGFLVWGTGVLVETLLDRGSESDLIEAQNAVDRLASLCVYEGSAMADISLLRLRALLSRARGDIETYRDLGSAYRAMAESLGFEGHRAMAEEMT